MTLWRHYFFFFVLILSLEELASDLTQRNPIYERGWF